MLFWIDSFLNRVTMYRLMLYFLLSLTALTIVLSYFGILPYNWLDLLLSATYLVIVCKILNKIFSKVFGATINLESDGITALIIALIVGPFGFLENIFFLTILAVVAIGSKYIAAWKRRHVFNPAAFGVLATALILGQGASWWIGSPYTFLAVLIGGLLVLRKIQRFTTVGVFLLIYFAFLASRAFALDTDPLFLIRTNLLFSPVLFFAVVMLIEPVTSPTSRFNQILYGLFVSIVFITYQNILKGFPYSLELALLTGNVFAFIVNKRVRTIMSLVKKETLAPNIVSFYFKAKEKINFSPGQYIEWTVPHSWPDSRGVRRFFTITSSPTEKNIMLTSKFPPTSPTASLGTSSFKRRLLEMKKGDTAMVFGANGEFTLPKNQSKKLVFIAGGIGITPFRSMVKYLLDSRKSYSIVLLYSAKSKREFVFKEIFDKAKKKVGLKPIYITQHIDEKVIKKHVPDWKERIFYVSGPEPMVRAMEKMLGKMGVKKLKRDYFPGYD